MPRLDRLVIDCIGAEDSALNRVFTRKQFTAAVACVFESGCKYDYCLALSGPEGTGKMSLLGIMGGSDCVYITQGKGGMYLPNSAWIVVLMGFRKSVVRAKAFISRQSDKYRADGDRHIKEHKRQCVLCGTTNGDAFLRGNRRDRWFRVIRVKSEPGTCEDWWGFGEGPGPALGRDRAAVPGRGKTCP